MKIGDIIQITSDHMMQTMYTNTQFIGEVTNESISPGDIAEVVLVDHYAMWIWYPKYQKYQYTNKGHSPPFDWFKKISL